MKNSADHGGCYPPRPLASVDNTLLDLQNSSYPTQPHSIIANYTMPYKYDNCACFWGVFYQKQLFYDLALVGYITNTLHLAREYPRISVRGYYLFPEANSFPRA